MQEILVSQEESGQRLDKYLRRRLPLAPSSFIYKMLRKKNITLRGKKADGSEKVEAGDSVKLFLSDETILKFSRPLNDEQAVREADEDRRAYRKLQPLLGPSPVLYEDDNILIVRKPAGVLSQKAEASDVSMNEWLRGYLAQEDLSSEDKAEKADRAEQAAVFRPSVCNRLDRNTGGILLCAKSLPGSRALSAVIRDRVIRKTYSMVVHGQIREAGQIDTDLIKDRELNRVRVADTAADTARNIDPAAARNITPAAAQKAVSGKRTDRPDDSRGQNEMRRHAVTIYRPVRTGKRATMVEADLITGRSHQLRVHMASIGHPIVSDPKYGSRDLDRTLLRLLNDKNAGRKEWRGQLLWCSEIAFPESFSDLKDAGSLQQVLAPLAGREFMCPPPQWWTDLCR